jgi:2-desacetyl-2-hydroxyethyl bacteriochlorophyllide A dehydrogenase
MRAVRGGGGPGLVEVVEVGDAPAIPAPDGTAAVEVTIGAAGICGSDLGYLAMGSTLPLGHELAGRTADGRAVAVEAIFACGTCDRCAAGAGNHCRTMHERVPGLSADGGMAERYVVPASSLVDLPAGLAVADACLTEPAAVSYRAVRLADVTPGARVAVIGGGAVGLLAVAAARHLGAGEVALDARRAERAAAGERLGATTAVTGEYDVVVDAAGTPEALARAVELLIPGGTLSIAALHSGDLPLPFLPAFLKEARVVMSMAYGTHEGRRDIDEAAAMLAANPGIAPAIITHRFPLEDAAEAFRVAADRSTGAIKVVVEP